MEINSISDIIIPQKIIGVQESWADEIYPIIKAYADFIGDEMSVPVTIENVRECEDRLRTNLPNDLKLFYLKYGAAKLSEILCEPKDFCYITSSWGQKMLDCYNAEEQEVLDKLIVFGEFLGNGNVWCFHKDNKDIYYFDHDTVPNINGMFISFYEYLQSLLIFTQAEIGQEIEGVENECEKIVINIIGKDRVKKWRYFSGWD